ncbi:hypothetical protein [Bradyrhizobium roseum]|uniref:hypothetical protein n=1 Tax=Bradyrhizobium roseum TaxID=3056648 RepID=UPI002639B276|nr:hypothetical protein [Bradyrhizobium roseus]WKA26356.1 hypothetical protein QUH67_22465 [Bradyrhizobium roseus]
MKHLFAPNLSREEAHYLCQRYDSDSDFWFDAAGRSIRRGDYSRQHFDTIFKWKTRNRGKSRPQKNKTVTIKRALKLAVDSVDIPSMALKSLVRLEGVGVPVASAIMAAIFPERFTIIDFRALEALGAKSFSTSSINRYLEYVSYCVALSAEWSMSLRELDRALWKWSEKQDAGLLQPVRKR